MAYLIPDNLRSRKDASEGVQKAAKALHIALDEDCTVWYEPPYDADGNRPDLVVMMRGCGLVAFEVLKLDRARFLGFFKGGIRLGRDNKEITKDSPLVRATRLSASLKKTFGESEVIQACRPVVKAGVVFPNLDRAEAIERGVEKLAPVEACLFADDLANAHTAAGERALTKWFVRLLGGEARDWSEVQERAIRAVIHPETVIGRAPKQLKLDPLTAQSLKIMDRQQEGFAKSLGTGHRVIRGVAGSGKTIVLLHRARLLSRMHPRWRILVTCYTRSLAGWLQAELSAAPNVDVIHLDALMARIIRSAGLKHPGYKSDDSGDKVATAAVKGLKTVGQDSLFDAVLLDEAQDFGTNALRFAVGLLAKRRDDLLIVADAAQNIFRRNFSWKSAGINAQGRTRILRVNYRNTKQVLEFASAFLTQDGAVSTDPAPSLEDEMTIIPPEAATRTGPAPVVTLADDKQELLERATQLAIKMARDHGQDGTVAVLYPSAAFGGRGSEGKLARSLRAAGLRVHAAKGREGKDALSESSADVVLSTIHSAKGLEWPSVLVVGLSSRFGDVRSDRMLGYVAMTRATRHLWVLADRGDPLAANLRAKRKWRY